LTQGASVWGISRSGERSDRGEPRYRGLRMDGRSGSELARLQEEVGFDHVVVAAGQPLRQPLLAIDADAAKDAFEQKFWTSFTVGTTLGRLMRSGTITFLSGIASRRNLPDLGMAGAVNAAVEAFAIRLAAECDALRVNVVCPGYVAGPDEGAIQRAGLPQVAARHVADLVLHVWANTGINGSVQIVDSGSLASTAK
jgi:NAD(P)-dependent dehydrogenase (short-subunit alcohol dehydrogenase family)